MSVAFATPRLNRNNLWPLHNERRVLACRIQFGCRCDDLDSSMFSDPVHRSIFDACDSVESVGLTPAVNHVHTVLLKSHGDSRGSELFAEALRQISEESVSPELLSVYANQVRGNADRFRLEQHFSEGLMLLRSGASVTELQEHANSLAGVNESADEIQFLSGPALAQLDTSLTYLVDDVIVQGQPLLLAGTKKTLKTNISIDLTISLATGSSFLGEYSVPRPIRAGLMSAESGAATIKETAHRVAMSKGLNGVQDCPDALFAFSTPMVSTAKECDRFRRIIEDNELQFLNIDPTYLTFVIGDDGKNLFRMGELLAPLSRISEQTGCTICLSHHSRKGTGKEGKPLELGDESYSGFSEWARQWIYLSRREAYNENLPGSHRLWLKWGGSGGHAGLIGLDIEEGSRKDSWGRRWDVRVVETCEIASEQRDAAEAEREAKHAATVEKNATAVLSALMNLPEGETENQIAIQSRLSGKNCKEAIDYLNETGKVIQISVKKGKKSYPGWTARHSDK